jgi:hypothetical protein
MKKVLLLLAATVILVGVWFVSYLVAGYPVQPHLYIQVAPWWHITLQIAWFLASWATAAYGFHTYWAAQSKKAKLSQQPPQHAQ